MNKREIYDVVDNEGLGYSLSQHFLESDDPKIQKWIEQGQEAVAAIEAWLYDEDNS